MLDEETSLQPSTSLGTSASMAQDTLISFDPRKLHDYFEQLLPLVLDADTADLENTLFTYPDTIEKFKRFANDPQTPVIFIVKEKEGGKDEGLKH